MDTDEYEISLAREAVVCAGYVKKYRRRLEEMELRYRMSTGEFLEQFRRGACPDKDFLEWHEIFEEFQRWNLRHEEYRQLLSAMKI